MELQHAFWTERREANHSFSQTIPIVVRFETVINETASSLCYKIGIGFCDDPTASFTCTLNLLLDCIKFTKNPDQFGRIFHELVNNQNSIMDLVNMNEDRLILSIRALDLEVITEMPWFSAILNRSSLTEQNQQMKLLVLQLQSELSQERQLSTLLRQQNDHLRSRLKTVEDASNLIKQTVETLVQPLIIDQTKTSNLDSSKTNSSFPLNLPIVQEAKLKIQESLQESLQPTKNESSTSISNVQLQDTRDELLLGIASYLLCAVCEKSVPASNTTDLNRHFIDEHVDDAKRQCLACPDANVFDLLAHIKTHTHRIYACEFCGKKGRKHYLKSHVRTHTGEKPYTCQICDRKFADQSTIRRHQTTVHSTEKRFICPICRRDISRKDNYRVHLKSHSGINSTSNQPKINNDSSGPLHGVELEDIDNINN